jgi:hypothetical protein
MKNKSIKQGSSVKKSQNDKNYSSSFGNGSDYGIDLKNINLNKKSMLQLDSPVNQFGSLQKGKKTVDSKVLLVSKTDYKVKKFSKAGSSKGKSPILNAIEGRASVGPKDDMEKGVYYNLYVKQRDENIRLKQTISQLVEELTESNKRSEVTFID